MATSIITTGADGFYHPSNENEIIDLVNYAVENKLEVRCRGSAHSVAQSIYTDPGPNDPPVPNVVGVETPPEGPNINLWLDKLMGLEWIDEEKGIVEAEAGIHLGLDPHDPAGASTLANSFLVQAFEKGWTLEDLGGITHQTVSGFLMTGSAGGTTMYSLEDNLLAFRVIDGKGNAAWVEKGTDLFEAVGLSMGLLGIIVKVRFQLTPTFNIYGQEITTRTALDKCPIDLFGPGTNKKPSYQEYLEQTPYTRMLWWPQKRVDRVVTWEAVRGNALPAFFPAPYIEFSRSYGITQIQQLGGAILFTTLGNRGFGKTWKKLQRSFGAFHSNLKKVWAKGIGGFLASIFSFLLTVILYVLSFPLVLFFSIFKPVLWLFYPLIVKSLQPLTKKKKPPLFMDYMWRSLPMDNAAGDILLGTEFTELWIPIEYSQQVMKLLKDHFDTNGRKATGTYSVEIYAGAKSSFWMSPSYGTDVIRVDVFWYSSNEGDPSVKGGFYEQYWELFVQNDIPFRLHWGKYLPNYEYPRWAQYLREQTPKWDDFMKLRKERDPGNLFYTDYWKKHFNDS